jgi:hypothetical protein
MLSITWSAALSAAAAGKYTLIVTQAPISRLASAILSGNTRRIDELLDSKHELGRVT